jgi:hypothetical protein
LGLRQSQELGHYLQSLGWMRVPEDVAGALDHVQAAASDAFVEDARVPGWDEGVAVARAVICIRAAIASGDGARSRG